jgi:adenylate cyclase class IV
MLIEVEVKSLIGNQDNAASVKQNIIELGGYFRSSENQKNFYYHRPTKDQCRALSTVVEEIQSLEHYLEHAQSISLRLRQINTDNCLLVAKISMDSDDAANGRSRIEVEKELPTGDIASLDDIFISHGLTIQSKWSRYRETYDLLGAVVTIDKNAGYGYLCEVEKVVTAQTDQTVVEQEVKDILSNLGLQELDSERLQRMFIFYNNNWEKYYNTDTVFEII